MNTELLKAIADNLSTLSSLITQLAIEPAEEKAKPAEPEKPAMTQLELRKKLGAYSIAGFTDTIREILQKHGVRLVKELKPEEYETVLKEVQEACD